MKKIIFLIMTGFVFLSLTFVMAADIPMMLNYQGYVEYGEEGNRAPFDGNGFFKFAIVDPNGNITYWSNDGTSTTGDDPNSAIVIPVTNGVFTVKLGDTDMTNMSVLPTTVFDQQNIYVRVWFSDDNIMFEQLIPDTQIVSAGFAYKAQTVVDSAITSAIIQDGTITNHDLSSDAGIEASKIDTTGLDADMVDERHFSDIENRIIGDIASHSVITNVHHNKTTSFTELTDTATDDQIPDDITINYAAKAGDAESLTGSTLGTPGGIATLDQNGKIPSAQLPEISNDIISLLNTIIPIGGIIAYFGDPGKLPDKWMVCDGSMVQDAESPLNYMFLPDLRDKFIRGESDGSHNIIDDLKKGGSDNHKHSVSSHKHPISHDGAHAHGGTTKPGGNQHYHWIKNFKFFNYNVNDIFGESSKRMEGVSSSEVADDDHGHEIVSCKTGGARSSDDTQDVYLHEHDFGTSNEGSHDHGGTTSEATTDTDDKSHLPSYVAFHYIIRIK